MTTADRLNDSDRTRRIPVRMVNREEEIDLVDLDVVEISRDCDKIQYDHMVIGYIQHVGHVFVALTGPRLDRAEECRQSMLWDHAAAELMKQAYATSSSNS